MSHDVGEDIQSGVVYCHHSCDVLGRSFAYRGVISSIGTNFILNNMETRNITITLEKAKEWYKKGGTYKEMALMAFSEEELRDIEFKDITTFEDVIKALNLNPNDVAQTFEHIKTISKASAASFKLNLIKKALNLGPKMNFTEGTI